MKVDRNYRISVTPDLTHCGEAASRSICQTITEDIMRHVDGAVDAEWDCDEICSFCEAPWEYGTEGEPKCCESAHAEWREES